MKIKMPDGTDVPDDVFNYKDVVLYVSIKAPEGGLLEEHDPDEGYEDDEDREPLERCGLRLAVDKDDVNHAEVEFALQRLITDLCAAGWQIDSIDGAG